MDVVTTVDTYVAAWNEPDAAKRAALLGESLADGCTYRDPRFSVEGRDALADHIAGYQQRFAEATMVRRSTVDAYDDVARFAWAILGADEDVLLEGTDVVRVDGDGRIRSVTGFFGPLA